MQTDPVTPDWTLGDRLAKARRQGGVSVETMALALGVSRKTVNNYEADRTPVRVGVIRVWAMQCGVPFEWLNTGSDQGKPSPACSTGYAVNPDSQTYADVA